MCRQAHRDAVPIKVEMDILATDCPQSPLGLVSCSMGASLLASACESDRRTHGEVEPAHCSSWWAHDAASEWPAIAWCAASWLSARFNWQNG